MSLSVLSMRGDAPALVLTHAADDHRRRLSTSAWVVLERLATEAVDRDGRVTTTVRQLGEQVGLNKDTVTRALQGLADAGLVARTDLRDGESGRFGSTSYLVDLAAAGFAPPCPDSSDAVLPTAPSRSSSSSDATNEPHHDDGRSTRRPEVDSNQLSLIAP